MITAPIVKTLIAGDAPRVTTLDGTRPPGALLAQALDAVRAVMP